MKLYVDRDRWGKITVTMAADHISASAGSYTTDAKIEAEAAASLDDLKDARASLDAMIETIDAERNARVAATTKDLARTVLSGAEGNGA